MRKRIVIPFLAAAVAAALAAPSFAAVPAHKGTVGPGFTISMASKPKKAGKIRLTVNDRASIHNFHLRGPGVNVSTSVGATGTRNFNVTLKKGTYTFVCDPHASSMRGSFRVT